MPAPPRPLLVAPLAACLAACNLFPGELAVDPPPLSGFEQPVELLQEPDDEAARAALPAGSTSGVLVRDARDSLEALTGDSLGLEVERVRQDSPGDFAGLRPGDLLLAAVTPDGEVELVWPSDWRGVELAHPPGTELTVVYDRAGREFEAPLVLAPRARPPVRDPAERFAEADRAGFVVRTATEVEARAAGLAPGAGAVLTGLDATSPWRGSVVFGDLFTAVDGRPVAHPMVLLDAVRLAEAEDTLALELVRDGTAVEVEVPVSRRASAVDDVWVPLLFRYERDETRRTWSAVLGLFRYDSTPAAWRVRLLWLIRFGGGQTDRLEEVDS